MNAIQFGRWLGERRHACGWTSQRALAAAAQRHPHTAGLHVSEAFLARLEAGLLAHPFRGTVRERVLALAWLVCKTSRQVRAYHGAAGLTDLTGEELHGLNALRSALSAPHIPPPVRLPWRVPQLIARQQEVGELVERLTQLESGCVVVTGLPGIGKTAVAAEALYLVGATPIDRGAFPDGIVTFDCTGRMGSSGLQSLLEDVAAVYGTYGHADEPGGRRAAHREDFHSLDGGSGTANLARATDRVRSALHGRRTLVLLDGVDPRLPLTLALEALLATDPGTPEVRRSPAVRRGRVVLVTSRYLPRGSQVAAHLALRPLDRDAALELLERSAGRHFSGRECDTATRLCEAAGGLPLAIEEVATSLAVAQLPLSPCTEPSLALRLLERQPGGDGIRERLFGAIGVLDDDARCELRRLAAAARTMPGEAARWQWHKQGHKTRVGDDQLAQPVDLGEVADHPRATDASRGRAEAGEVVVAAIAELVRHSLVEPLDHAGPAGSIESRYSLNPLVREVVLGGAGDDTVLAEPDVGAALQGDMVRFLRHRAPRGPALGRLGTGMK